MIYKYNIRQRWTKEKDGNNINDELEIIVKNYEKVLTFKQFAFIILDIA